MSVDKIIASIPKMDAEKRKTVRQHSTAGLNNPKLAEGAKRVIEALDTHEQRLAVELSDHVRGLSVAQRVAEAFTLHPMTEAESKTVQVLLDNPGQTSFGLSQLASWGGQIWHEKFGTLCKKRESRLWPAEPSVVRDANFFSGILADLDKESRWTIKPEVAEGLAMIGIKPSRR